jgi:hypothetical protein
VIPEAVAEGLPAKWVISDTHWTQPDLDIIFNRPSNWKRLAINAWKATVGAEDTALHLGDVAGSSLRKDLLPLGHRSYARSASRRTRRVRPARRCKEVRSGLTALARSAIRTAAAASPSVSS